MSASPSPNLAATQPARTDDSGASREQILKAAATLFAQQGFAGTSFGAVAAAAGQSKALVQYHFPNKDALWRESIRHILAQRTTTLPQYLEPGVLAQLDEHEQSRMIHTLCKQLLLFSLRHPEWIRILYQEAAQPGPRLDWLIDECLRQDFHNGKAMIQLAQARGLLPKEVDPMHLLHVLSGAVFHLVNIAPLIQRVLDEDVTSDTYINQYVDSFIGMLKL